MTSVIEVYSNNSIVEVLPVSEIDVIEIVTPGPQGPSGDGAFTPLPDRPTTLNEVILGGVTLGLWP